MLVETFVSASCMAPTLTTPSSTGYWPKGVFARLRPLIQPLARNEAALVTPTVRFRQLILVDSSDPEQQLELVSEMRTHHLRTVGRDREGDALLRKGSEGLPYCVLIRQRLRQQVRRRADLEDDLRLADLLHQLRLARGENAVADPVGPQRRDDLANLRDPVRAALLADVDRDAQPGFPSLLDHRQQSAIGVGNVAVGTGAGDVDADDPARRV